MTDLNKGVTKPRHHIRLWRGARSDFVLQICFLEKKKKNITGDHFSSVALGKYPTKSTNLFSRIALFSSMTSPAFSIDMTLVSTSVQGTMELKNIEPPPLVHM